MITHSRLHEIRKKLFGRKLAKRPKPPNEAERLYLGSMRNWADSFRSIVGGAIREVYPELLDPANVRKDGFDPDEPRDEQGRWTGGGNPEMAGRHQTTGKLLKPRAYEWTDPSGAVHRFTDKPGERDTHTFENPDQIIREAGAKERMHEAISQHATAHPGFDYTEAKSKKDPENAKVFHIMHIHDELGAKAKRSLFEPGGTWTRTDGEERLDALRIGPLMLGKRASKVLHGITNPLRAAADRVPLGQVAGTVQDHVEHDVPRYMPGLANTDLFLGSEIASWRKENTDLITNLNDEMLERIGDLLEDYDGTRVEEIATALEDTFGFTRARAELIARDQVLKLNGRMNQRAQMAVGVESYRWSTSNDGSVRDDHDLLADNTFRWDDPPITNQHEVDKGKPERRGGPGSDYQCRCIAIPVLEEFDMPALVESEELDGGWDETAHPREPAGSPNGGEFAGGVGSGHGNVQHTGGLQIHNPDKVQANARALFGRDLTHEDIKNLTQVHALNIPGADHIEYQVWPHGAGGISYEARVKDAAGKDLLEVKRQVETNWEAGKREVEIHHDRMIVAKELQGHGIGSKLFDAQLQQYQKQGGFDRITTSAAWTGQYQWPRLGFSLEQSEHLEGLKSELTKFAADRGIKYDASKLKSVHDLARERIKIPFEHEGKQTTNLGKAFLSSRPAGHELALKFELGPKSKELKAYVKTGKH